MFPAPHATSTQFALYNVLLYQSGLRLHRNQTCCSNGQWKQGEKKPEQCQVCHYTTNPIWWIHSTFSFLLPFQCLDKFHGNVNTLLFSDLCMFCEYSLGGVLCSLCCTRYGSIVVFVWHNNTDQYLKIWVAPVLPTRWALSSASNKNRLSIKFFCGFPK
jgi:hypothetical protein